jgi:hypothetical protein
MASEVTWRTLIRQRSKFLDPALLAPDPEISTSIDP